MPQSNSINAIQQGTQYFNGTATFTGVDGSTAGFVYTSNGTGVAPSFQAAASSGFTSVVVQTFLGSQSSTLTPTYTPTSGMKYCIVEIIGSGGGGGGSATTAAGQAGCGSGGGGGGYNIMYYSAADIGATAAITLNQSGTAGSSAGGNGGTGGSTVFSPTGTGVAISAAGGIGGTGSGAAATNCFKVGAQGGQTFANGLINGYGGVGSPSIGFGASVSIGGNGGNSSWGSGATGGLTTSGSSASGTAGVGGGGGGRATLNSAGGVGGSGGIGVVKVTEFI